MEKIFWPLKIQRRDNTISTLGYWKRNDWRMFNIGMNNESIIMFATLTTPSLIGVPVHLRL